MKRTQIQLPDALYAEVKRVAELSEWSISEVLRRKAEYIVTRNIKDFFHDFGFSRVWDPVA